MVFDQRKNFIMQILEHRGNCWKKHLKVGAGSSNSARKDSKEGFAWNFSVMEKTLAGEGWFFEQR